MPTEVHYMEKNPGMFSSKTLIYFRLKKDMNILDGIGMSKLSGIFLSENTTNPSEQLAKSV